MQQIHKGLRKRMSSSSSVSEAKYMLPTFNRLQAKLLFLWGHITRSTYNIYFCKFFLYTHCIQHWCWAMPKFLASSQILSLKTISSLLSFAVAELLRRIQAQNQENAEFGSTQDHPHFRIWSGSLNSQYFRVWNGKASSSGIVCDPT